MKLKVLFTSVCLLFALPVLTIAANPPVVKWTINHPFEQKAFIENKGQYELQDKRVAAGDILYGADNDGLHYYFTKDGIWIGHDIFVKRTQQEIDEIKAQMATSGLTIPDNKLQYKSSLELQQFNFINANPAVRISSENEINSKFNFILGKTSVVANAYKKIIYSDIYPGIDITFYFPENKTGFEYDVIVHPGADVSQLKMQYPLNQGVSLSSQGNVVIKSIFGDFTDHAPTAFQGASTNPVSCSFTLNNGIVQFKVGRYDKSSVLKIDPYVTLYTSTPGTNPANAYYVDYDDGGNCYIYGGKYHWVVQKFNSLGVSLWSTTILDFNFSSPAYIGHFGVDRISQSVFVVEGFNQTTGSAMDKLNSAGVEIASYAGNTNLKAMWRIAFSRCNPSQAVVGGGNIVGGPYNSAFYLDETLATVNPQNVLNAASGYNDVCLLTLDNNSPNANAYMSFCSPAGGNSNKMLKVPTTGAALSASSWTVQDGYKFETANSVVVGSFGASSVDYPNGFSGMTYGSGNNLYTYDSYKLKKWNSTNGALVTSVTVNTNPNGDSLMLFAGLTSDVCDHIFIGTVNKGVPGIQQYNSALTTVGAEIVEGDTVYDVKMGNKNILYACGKGFVTAVQFDTLTLPFCNPFHGDTVITPVTCSNHGSATINPNPAQNGTTYNYSCKWSDGQVGFTATGLPVGTDTAFLTDSSCMVETIKIVVHIKEVATFPPGKVTPNPTAICNGSSVLLTASGATTYTWLSSTLGKSPTLTDSSGLTVTANPTVSTTYVMIARQPGDCPDTVRAVVTVNPLPVINITPALPAVCTGQGVVLTASGASTYAWAPGAGLSAVVGSTVTATPAATTTYTITGTDVNGCIHDTTVVVTVNPFPIITLTPTDTQTICFGSTTNLLANSTIGGTTFKWVDSSSLNTGTGAAVIAKPTVTTTYTVTGTANGCATTALDTVTVNPLPIVNITGLNPTYCVDAAAVVLNGDGTPSGNGGSGTFSGPGVTEAAGDSTFTPSVAGTGGPYTITYTYTDGHGCTNSGTASVTVAPLPVLSFTPTAPVVCSGNPITINIAGATDYTWAPDDGTLSATTGSAVIADPVVAETYTVTGTDGNGCVSTINVPVNIGVLPHPGFLMNVPSQCNSLSVQFVDTDVAADQTYLWKFGDTATSTQMDPPHVYAHGGTFTVTLIETNAQGCIDSSVVKETVTSLEEIAILPNAFTPDNTLHPENNFFGPQLECNEATAYIFRIYNRWGQLVFETNSPPNESLYSPEGKWDGRFNQGAEPVGVYVYYLQFTCGDCPISRKGNVTLLR